MPMVDFCEHTVAILDHSDVTPFVTTTFPAL